MSSTFDIEMNKLSQEIVSLKSQKPQPASVLETYTTSVDLTFNLVRKTKPILQVISCSDKMAIIDFGITNNPLATITYDITSNEGRLLRADPYYITDNGHLGRMVFVADGNASDREKIFNGETVTVNLKVIITSTEEITPTVTYKDLWII